MDQRFPKEDHLKSRKAIAELFKKNDSFSPGKVRGVFRFYPHASSGEEKKTKLQVGFSVPRKKMKKAVDRNRSKRLMKEAYRKNKHMLLNVLEENHLCCDLMLIRTDSTPVDQEEIEEKIILILQRMVKATERFKA